MDKITLIDNLDLTKVKTKLCLPVEKGGYAWPPEGADEVILEYREFLRHIATAKADEKRPPTKLVDIVWHTHILFTEDYHRDCEAIFGHYQHHRPTID